MSEDFDIRDYFAAKAMQSWITLYGENIQYEQASWRKESSIAYMAYRVADAMMERREELNEQTNQRNC